MTKTGTMKLALALFAGAVVAVGGAAHAEQGADKALRDGEHMIAQCLDYAALQKYPPLSVGVIDSSGTLVAFKRQDGAAAASADAALLKARTSLRLGAPTADLGAVSADPSTRDAFLILQMTTLPGGMPIAGVGAGVTGAVGVSGGLDEQDAECARQAVAIRGAGKK